MGDIADMMLDGTLDFYTGEYIGRGKGYPRTSDKSLPWEKERNRPAWFYNSSRNKYDSKHLYGIKCFLYNNCYNYLDTKKGNDMFDEILTKYGQTPERIQHDWEAFKSWVKSNYPPCL